MKPRALDFLSFVAAGMVAAALVVLVALLTSTHTCAAVFEVNPAPPATVTPPIPATAARNTECVGVDNTGVAYCNVIYTWSTGRWAKHQRNLSFTIGLDNQITWLTPAPGKTDTVITGVAGSGRIGGHSTGIKLSLPVATVWTGGVPLVVAGTTVAAISDYAYASAGQVITWSGVSIKPPTCGAVYALNDVGDGVCWRTITFDGGDESGPARFSDPPDEDRLSPFITTYAPYRAVINDRGDVVVTLSLAPALDYGAIYQSLDGVRTYTRGARVMHINNDGHYAGALNGVGAVWIDFEAVLINGTSVINAINDSGALAYTAQRGTQRFGGVADGKR